MLMTDRHKKMKRPIHKLKRVATHIANMFLEHFVDSYGATDHLLSDNGLQIESRLFTPFCGLLRLMLVRRNAYHLQKNEQVERCEKTIFARLRHYVVGHQDN